MGVWDEILEDATEEEKTVAQQAFDKVKPLRVEIERLDKYDRYFEEHWDQAVGTTKNAVKALRQRDERIAAQESRIQELTQKLRQTLKLNVAQKAVLLAAVATIGFMGLYPPWTEFIRGSAWCSSDKPCPDIGPRSAGYYWIFSPPGVPRWAWAWGNTFFPLTVEMAWNHTIDMTRLMVEWVTVILVAFGLIWSLSGVETTKTDLREGTKRLLGLNHRRGFQRVYLVLSVVWIVGVLAVSIRDRPRPPDFDAIVKEILGKIPKPAPEISRATYWEDRAVVAFLPPVLGYPLLFHVLPWIKQGFALLFGVLLWIRRASPKS